MKKHDVRVLVNKHFQQNDIRYHEYHLSKILTDCESYNIESYALDGILQFIKVHIQFFRNSLAKYDANLAFVFYIYCNVAFAPREKCYNYVDYDSLQNLIMNNIHEIVDENHGTSEETFHDILAQLKGMIGLNNIKKEIEELASLAVVNKEKLKFKLPINIGTLHLVFKGNPGTGKTTVARLIGKLYKEIGLLSSGHLIEVARHDIIAKHVGHTAILVAEKFKEAKNGVLFIDEAYTLNSNETSNDFGNEAIQTILKLMEDYRHEIVVIVAGYPHEMNLFLNSNPGLKSRFKNIINFEDYNYLELIDILINMIKNDLHILTDDAYHKIKYIFEDTFKFKGSYSNARFVRNYYEQILKEQAARLSKVTTHTYDSLRTITVTDIIEI